MNGPINLTPEEVRAYYSARFPQISQDGNAWRGPCPFDQSGSSEFRIDPTTGRASCLQCKGSWSVIELEQALTGADLEPARERVFSVIGRRAATGDKKRRQEPARNTSPMAGAAIAPNTDSGRCEYILNSRGEIRPVLANVVHLLRTAWPGVLAYDEFNLGVTVLENPPALAEGQRWTGAKRGEKWTDDDDRLAAIWIQRHGIAAADRVIGQAIQTVARDRPFHPVREHLESLSWDGTPRLDSWLTTYLGVESNTYVRAVASRFLISMIARVLQPGCKCDTCLILEGPQGQGKSTALRLLADPWFTDHVATLGSKDSQLQLQGAWVIELAELEAMTKAGAAKAKGFLSRTEDRFRPPYGRRLIRAPRQCVFAGTVNHSGYLQDQTGNRRFWPVRCGQIDLDALAKDRGQLLAEALVRYRAASVWWLETDELSLAATAEQEERLEADPWEGVISSALAAIEDTAAKAGEAPKVAVSDLLIRAVSVSINQQTRAHEMRAASILRRLGWERRRGEKLPDGTRPWVYRPKK